MVCLGYDIILENLECPGLQPEKMAKELQAFARVIPDIILLYIVLIKGHNKVMARKAEKACRLQDNFTQLAEEIRIMHSRFRSALNEDAERYEELTEAQGRLSVLLGGSHT